MPSPQPPTITELRNLDWQDDHYGVRWTYLNWAGYWWILKEQIDDDSDGATSGLGSYAAQPEQYYGDRTNGVFYGPRENESKSFFDSREAEKFLSDLKTESDQYRRIDFEDIEEIYYVSQLQEDEKIMLQNKVEFVEIQNLYSRIPTQLHRIYFYEQAEKAAEEEEEPIVYRVVWREEKILAENGPTEYERGSFEYWIPDQDPYDNLDVAAIMKNWETMESYGKDWDYRVVEVTAYATEEDAEEEIGELTSSYSYSVMYEYFGSDKDQYFDAIQDALLNAYGDIQ